MKKIFFLFAILSIAPVMLNAASPDSADILLKILESNKHVRTMQAPYTHHRISGKNVSDRKGNFYYVANTAQLAMRYTLPEGRYFVVSDNHLYNKIGVIPMHFNTKRSSLMRLFGNCMVWAVSGEVQKIFENNNVVMSVAVDEADNSYVIEMTARSGFNKGISRIVLKYDRTTCLIFHLEVDEVTGVDHLFRIGRQPVLDQPIDNSHFEI